MTAYKLRCGHAPLSRGLELQDFDRTLRPCSDPKTGIVVRLDDHLSGSKSTRRRTFAPRRPMDDQSQGRLSLTVPISIGRGPRLHGTDLVTHIPSMTRPVDLAMLLG